MCGYTFSREILQTFSVRHWITRGMKENYGRRDTKFRLLLNNGENN